MRLLLLVSVLGVTTPAFADLESARDDIVDMRRGRMPSRSAALGWTDQGAFVFRRTRCGVQDLSDIPGCEVVIEVAARGGTQSQLLFSTAWDDGCVESETPDPKLGCWKLSTDAASSFLAAERALRARLGPLTAGIPTGTTLPAGTIRGVRYDDERADRRRAAIVLGQRGGRWRALRVLWSVETGKDEFLRSDPVIEHVERSPDGRSLAVVTALAHAEDDYYWQSVAVAVVPMPGTPASAP